LLAERSRRITDELHETRPRWLRTISFGIVLILLSIILMIAWTINVESVIRAIIHRWKLSWDWSIRLAGYGYSIDAVIFFLGVLLLTRREGYAPADKADRWLRRWLRLAALVPLSLLAVSPDLYWDFSTRAVFWGSSNWKFLAITFVGTFGVAPLPLLLFLRLRGLATRAHSAHLAEHCTIVGIGMTAALIYKFVVYELMGHAWKWGFSTYWTTRSTTALVVALLLAVSSWLFILWSGYIMLRFAAAFWWAARQRSRKWRRDDRSITQPS
jgi:hypothetical protein